MCSYSRVGYPLGATRMCRLTGPAMGVGWWFVVRHCRRRCSGGGPPRVRPRVGERRRHDNEIPNLEERIVEEIYLTLATYLLCTT
jgi:hypothetical protein